MSNIVQALVLATALCRPQGGPSFEERNISAVEWSVNFVSAVYNPAANTTTFTYSLTALSGKGYKDLSHWVLAVPSDCEQVPTGSGTKTSFGLDPTTGVYGYKWDDGQVAGNTQTYTLTFSGHMSIQEVEYSVKGGTYYAIGKTTGPGCHIVDEQKYSLSGIAYVDANGNGVLDQGEPRLSNVSVSILDSAGNVIGTVLTNGSGEYVFNDVKNGTYTVSIFTSTAAEDLNEILTAYFITPSLSLTVGVSGNDSAGNNFPFQIKVADILSDLNPADPDGDLFTISGTGKTIGFWKHQISVAISGKGRAQIPAATVKSYLMLIQGLYLADPFFFPAGHEYSNALSILSSTSSLKKNLLLKQLLGTELNHVAGMGLTGSFTALQGVLIAWGEYLAANSGIFTDAQLVQAKDVFDAINNTGE